MSRKTIISATALALLLAPFGARAQEVTGSSGSASGTELSTTPLLMPKPLEVPSAQSDPEDPDEDKETSESPAAANALLGGDALTSNFGDPGTDGGGAVSDPLFQFNELARQKVDERLAAQGADLFGDTIDPYTGALVFEQVDVSLPGNSGLEVAVRRRREQRRIYSLYANAQFGDWTIDSPRITTKVARPINRERPPQCDVYGLLGGLCITEGAANFGLPVGKPGWHPNRCDLPFGPGPINVAISIIGGSPTPVSEENFINDYEYSNGVMLRVPGQGAKQLNYVGGNYGASQNARYPNLYQSGAKKATLDGWIIKCGVTAYVTDNDALVPHGQGFTAIAPNGDQYRFDRVYYRDHVENYDGAITITEASVFATEVKDVNGNWVRYDYDMENRLARIYSNDGREIQFHYVENAPLVESVTANGRTWRYSYTPNHEKFLRRVTLPDGRFWEFGIGSMNWGPEAGNCTQARVTAQAVHPNGAVVTFELDELRHGRTRIPAFSAENPPNRCPYRNGSAPKVPYFEAMSVVKKTLTYDGRSHEWTYDYIDDDGSFRPSGAADLGVSAPTAHDLKITNVTDPLGNLTRYTHSRRWGLLEGKLMKVERYAGASSLLEKTEYTYLAEQPIGYNYLLRSNYKQNITPVREHTIKVTRGSDVYNTRYTYNTNQNAAAYSWGAPVKVEQWSNIVSATRVVDTTYEHNKTKWILRLPKTEKRNGKLFNSYTYDSLGRVTRTDRFGVLYKRYEYRADGTVERAFDALNRRTYLGYYKRGVPQRILRPDNVWLDRTVDDNGWTTSVTNARGYKTYYQHNAVGWLTKIDRPSPWSDTTVSYSGLGGANFYQKSIRGTQESVVWYDGLSRPVRTRSLARSGGGATSYTRTAYDALGRETFVSFPSASSYPTQGVETTYDALGRVTRTRETVSPYATTTTDYLAGNKIRVTDAEGHQTTTTRSGYGSPEDGNVTKIEQPENVVTDMAYDIYGNLLSARQYGNTNGYSVDETQTWDYDNRLRVCAHTTPETGRTLYAYDNADQLTSYAEGQSVGSGCATPPSNVRVSHTYDTLGRLTLKNYPDGTLDIAYAYDANGNVTAVNRGSAYWDYAYDNGDNVIRERLRFYQREWAFDYAYNTDGAIVSRTSPSGATVYYDPNGLGQSTALRVGGISYVDAANYHPNGAFKSASLSNSHNVTQALNARQLVSAIRTEQPGGVRALYHSSLSYDRRGKLTSYIDYSIAGTATNRTFEYDDIGRLTRSTGSFGTASYTYDPLGNIRTRSIGGRSVTIGYNGANRVSTVTDTANPSRSFTHDSRGNVVNDGRYAFSYNRANQPVTLTGSGVDASYLYDGNLKRMRSIEGGETIYWVYSNVTGGLAFKDNITTGERADYHGLGPTQLRLKNGTTPTFVHLDHLGSATAGTNANGAVLWREDYAPFGERLNEAAGVDDDTGFTGHVQDADTGLTYMQARYYDPVIGRFLSNDPVGFVESGFNPGMFNRYSYVHNDPINKVDPDGQIARLAVSAFKIARRTVKARGNVVKAVRDEAASIADAAGTVLDPSASGIEKAAAVFEVAVGFKAPGVGGKKGAPGPSGGKPSTLEPGPNAGESIPARGPGRDFTSGERSDINRIGGESGCHTCGSTDPGTKSGNFVPDHQPPSALNDGGSQRLFPQCKNCSNRQGGQVSAEKRRIEREDQ